MKTKMHKGTILVVDDEEVILKLLERKLTSAGYYVSTAHSGDQALSILQGYCYDLLLTDFIMGGMTGVQLIEQAKREHPQIKAIVMSGYANENLANEIIGPGNFFYKPIAVDLLLKRIAELLK